MDHGLEVGSSNMRNMSYIIIHACVFNAQLSTIEYSSNQALAVASWRRLGDKGMKVQESHAIASPAMQQLFVAVESSPNALYKFKIIAKLRKPSFRAIDIPAQNRV